MVSSPKYPSASETATAQSGLNRDTALTQQQVNMVNQVTPYGNLTYNQTGTSNFVDSNGKTVSTPTYTATTTLSPEQQGILDQSNTAALGLGKLANQQISSLTDQLSKPFSYSTSDAENYAYNLGKERLDPQYAQEEDKLKAQLIASGVRPGTAAYNQQMTQLSQAKNDAYTQLALGAQQQGYNQALTTYNNPINVISSLTSGSQVTNPTFTSTPQTSVGGVDYTGLVNNQYNSQVQSANATNGALGGLFGLGTSLLFSDRRLKTHIRRLRTLANGLGWYVFRYLWEDKEREGVMSDEVRKIMPKAVSVGSDGFDRVDYGKVLA